MASTLRDPPPNRPLARAALHAFLRVPTCATAVTRLPSSLWMTSRPARKIRTFARSRVGRTPGCRRGSMQRLLPRRTAPRDRSAPAVPAQRLVRRVVVRRQSLDLLDIEHGVPLQVMNGALDVVAAD